MLLNCAGSEKRRRSWVANQTPAERSIFAR